MFFSSVSRVDIKWLVMEYKMLLKSGLAMEAIELMSLCVLEYNLMACFPLGYLWITYDPDIHL